MEDSTNLLDEDEQLNHQSLGKPLKTGVDKGGLQELFTRFDTF